MSGLCEHNAVEAQREEEIVQEILTTIAFDPHRRYKCPHCKTKDGLVFDRPEYLTGEDGAGRGYKALYKCSNCGELTRKGQYPTPPHIIRVIVRWRLRAYSTAAIAEHITDKESWRITGATVFSVIKRSPKLAEIKEDRRRRISD
jgi:ribosomal protein L37AE/L43A